MRRRTISVTADDEAAALEKAVAELEAVADNVRLEPDGRGGYQASLKNADAEIEVEVPGDGMEARIADYAPAAGLGEALTPENLKERLELAGLGIEPDPEGAAQIFDRLDKGLDVRGIVVARGTPPQDGEDGRVEMAVETVQSIGSLLEDGRVDFYERGTVHTVTEGQLLAHVIPAQKGTPGRDVRGKVLPARDGRGVNISAGKDVEAAKDGTEFRAKAGGMVVFARNTLSVTDTIEIRGDIDFSSGNIRMEEGSVVVRGTIRSGFTVVSGGNVIIGEAIENAFVEAEGDVVVRRGIVMREGGYIKAGGDVVAHFAENARIEADGNVVITHDITNCNLLVLGEVIATKGKGRIQGGRVRCGSGVEAKQIGSRLGVPTTIILGLDPEGHDELMAEKRELRGTVRRAERVLGTRSLLAILRSTPRSRRKAVSRLLRTVVNAHKRIDEIDAVFAKHLDLLKQSIRARVKVSGSVYPGTVLMIAGCRFDVEELIEKSQFYYDLQSDSVCVAPL